MSVTLNGIFSLSLLKNCLVWWYLKQIFIIIASTRQYVLCSTSLFVYSPTFWGVFLPFIQDLKVLRIFIFGFCESFLWCSLTIHTPSLKTILHFWFNITSFRIIVARFKLYSLWSICCSFKRAFIPQSINPAIHWKLVSSLFFILVLWSFIS